MEIIRSGIKITLTSEEREAAYREAQTAYMREEVETVIKNVCGNTGIEISEKVKKDLISDALNLYEYYEGKSDDCHYNCTEAVKDTISEFAVRIGKRKALLLCENCY